VGENRENVYKSTVCSATKKYADRLSGCGYSLCNFLYNTWVLWIFDKNWCCKLVRGWSTNRLIYGL